VVSFKGGPWFLYHYLWALGLAVVGLACGVAIYLGEKGRARRQVVLLVGGAAASLLVDVYVVTHDSSLRWVMLSAATYLWTEGTVFYAVFRHGLLELAPIAKDRIFRDLPDPLLVLDEKERLQDFNEAAGRLFGLGPKSLRQPWRRLKPEVSLGDGEYCHREPDQRVRYFHVAPENLSSATGTLGKLVCFREITAQKMIERDLNQNLEFRARLLSMVAHDVHGMMSAQTAFSSHLDSYVQPEYKGFVGALTERVHHSQNLMTNILGWARTQRANFVPLMRDYELNVLIRDVLSSLEDSVRLHRIQTELVSEVDPLVVAGDPVMTESVIRNLLRNAIRATPPGKTVRMYLRADGKMAFVEVHDEGIGLGPERLRAILESTIDFVAELENRPKGFGLGLTIARQFVALQGGEFSMESELGQGTRVRFSVPL
jgi:signal transduction histidine kinase